MAIIQRLLLVALMFGCLLPGPTCARLLQQSTVEISDTSSVPVPSSEQAQIVESSTVEPTSADGSSSAEAGSVAQLGIDAFSSGTERLASIVQALLGGSEAPIPAPDPAPISDVDQAVAGSDSSAQAPSATAPMADSIPAIDAVAPAVDANAATSPSPDSVPVTTAVAPAADTSDTTSPSPEVVEPATTAEAPTVDTNLELSPSPEVVDPAVAAEAPTVDANAETSPSPEVVEPAVPEVDSTTEPSPSPEVVPATDPEVPTDSVDTSTRALPVPVPSGGERFVGDGTAYSEAVPNSGAAFACSYRYLNDWASVNFAAINVHQWDNGNACGRCVTARCVDPRCATQNKDVTVMIVDQCPECAPGDVDFSIPAYRDVTGMWPHRLQVEWEWSDCSPYMSGTIKMSPKDGSNPHWRAFYFANMKYPLKAAYLNGQEMTRNQYQFYEQSGPLQSSNTFELEAVNGERVSFTVGDPMVEQDLGVQFP